VEVASGREKYPTKSPIEGAAIPVGARCLGSHRVRLFRSTQLCRWLSLVAVTILHIYWAKDCVEGLPVGAGAGYALLE